MDAAQIDAAVRDIVGGASAPMRVLGDRA